ncbi:chromate efflux transporter [Akkermansiaceae bacterium]|nr:chromate efflux transporter [Akkermansiaceae bacterium]
MTSALECFLVALRLGLTSFGGPVAHVGYFEEEYVQKRKWLSEERFGELMALSQFIPGPGSSQLGAAIGHERAGLLGGFAAWFGFTLPSALVLLFVAMGIGALSGGYVPGMLHGMKLVAIAVVAGAWMGMRSSLATGTRKFLIALFSLVILYLMPSPWMTLVVIAVAALVGVFLLNAGKLPAKDESKTRGLGGILAMAVFFILLFLSLKGTSNSDWQQLGGIYRAGALVFGGGHVVLPMLQETMVDGGFMGKDGKEIFLGGYGATQAVPGPVFTFASFLGGHTQIFGNPWLGAGAAVVAVFLPGMLLLGGTMSVWGRLRGKEWAQKAVQGANAAVVGILGVALIKMATGGAIGGWQDVLGAVEIFLNGGWQDALSVVVLFLILQKKFIPVWALVILAAGVGALIG